MPVVVVPETFSLVAFEASAIAEAVADVAGRLGMGDLAVRIEVDETTPLTKVAVRDEGDAVVVRADSGALEDTRRPRQLSTDAVQANIGRALVRVLDRRSGRFTGAPPDEALELAHLAAWDTTAVGRLARAGVPVHRQRWLYNFRNRHGFRDVADLVFARLWEADEPTWDQLVHLSATARTDTLGTHPTTRGAP